MSKVYDDWERLVGAILRQELREIALCDSFSSSSNISSDFCFDVSGTRIQNNGDDVKPMPLKELKRQPETFDLIGSSGKEDLVLFIKDGLTNTRLLQPSLDPEWQFLSRKWIATSGWAVCSFLILHYIHLFSDTKLTLEWMHPNLVKLIAYCSEDDNIFLVYESMSKGSLENHLFRRSNISLSWATRMKVAEGAARGLSFLHVLETPVIYRDFKTAMILLDGEFNPKLCGLGLAREGPIGDMTHVSTRVMGTLGYTAREYYSSGHLTLKCDVFSFGVVLLELLSGCRAKCIRNEQMLVQWAKPYLHDNTKFHQFIDPKLEGQHHADKVYAVGTLALQCINLVPKLRPQMTEVVVALAQLGDT